MIENPKVGQQVEVQLIEHGDWVPGTIREIGRGPCPGTVGVHVPEEGNIIYYRPLARIRPATKPLSPPVSVWVRVKAEIEFELPSPWDGKTSHNDLVPIAKREAREVLQEHLPPKGRIIDIHTVQTSVVSETKEKP